MPLMPPRWTWPGSTRPTLMLLAMQPRTLPQPTTSAIVASFMQFCSDTTSPPGADDDDSLAHGSLPTAVLDGILAAAGVCRQRATLYSGVAAKAGTQPSTTRKLTSGSRLSPGRRA